VRVLRVAFAVVAGCGRIGFDARPPQPNVVFVTLPELAPGTFGDVAAGDAACQAAASDAGLVGRYVAWLSSTTSNAIDRLGDARGWVRPDGLPFADTIDDIVAGRIITPITLAADGTPQPAADVVVTGTDELGFARPNDNCADFTSTAATAGVGSLAATAYSWTIAFGAANSCAGGARIYCFGVDDVFPVTLPAPAVGRHGFLSSEWQLAGGLAGADAHCQADADANNLPGSYAALLATSTATAAARFDASRPPWVRRDGLPLAATAGELLAGQHTVPLNVDATGAYINFDAGQASVWTGALGPSDPAKSTCGDWTDVAKQGTQGAGQFAGPRAFFNGDFPCNFTNRLYCLER